MIFFSPKISLQLPIITSPNKLGKVADKELTLIQKFVSALIFAFAAIPRLVFDSPTFQDQKTLGAVHK